MLNNSKTSIISPLAMNPGFVVQTLIIGIGTWIASNLPWIVSQLGVNYWLNLLLRALVASSRAM